MASRGAQRAALEDIRDTEAQGTASLPLRPAAVPLTNAPVGQTPAGSSQMYSAAARASPQTYAANVPPPSAPTVHGMTREQQRAQGMAALQRSREGLDSREAKLRTDGRQGRRQ